MKTIGFIGTYDKTDLVIYVAKVLQTLKKEVLVIDATITQKAKYVVPVVNPTIKYVTEFEEIDIAVGFRNIDDIKAYLGLAETQDLGYDVVLIDTDNPVGFSNFNIEMAEKKYFVTSFDSYALKKGLEAFSPLTKPIVVDKVLFARDMLKEEDDYLNFLSLPYKINWTDNRLYLPLDTGDLSAIYENHRVQKIKFKKLSIPYKDGIAYLAEEILGDSNSSEIRRVMKIIERGV